MATITSDNYFGSRHGLEALFQLMEYDDLLQDFIMVSAADIKDMPEFSHRGISLDTSRNFIAKDTLMSIIDGMGASKVKLKHDKKLNRTRFLSSSLLFMSA